MRDERAVQGRWQTLSRAEKIFTIFITLSIVGGLGLLALDAISLVKLPGFLG